MISVVNYDLNLKHTIVLLSDIHYKNKKDYKKLDSIMRRIKKIHPDYICITGDIIDDNNYKDKEYLIKFITELSYISKVIMCLGNHEYYIDKKRKVFGLDEILFKQISLIDNVYLLKNDNVVFEDINFYGVHLPIEYYMHDKESLSSFNKYIKIKTIKDKYNVVLIHSPINIVNYKSINDIDLVLSGHMHGGLTPNVLRKILKGTGLVSPLKTLFPKYAYGHIKYNNTSIVISGGINKLSNFLLRKILLSEIIVIK